MTADFFQAGFDLADAHTQQTAVGFELGFTRPAHANAATLTLKVSPAAYKARAHVVKLGQFDLQLTFMGTGALSEDIENQPGTVKHATLENSFEVTLLTGREDVIENHNVDLLGLDQVA